MWRALLLLSFVAVVGVAVAQIPSPLKSGVEFQPEEMRKLQADEFANPAMLWVSQGEQRWRTARGDAGKSCADCHGESAASMKGVATRYPRFQSLAGRVLNLEGQINYCTTERQKSPALAYESDPMLALSSYVARQSFGMPMAIKLDVAARPVYEQGQDRKSVV